MPNSLFYNPDFAASKVASTFAESPLGFVDVGARGGAHKLIEPVSGMSAVMCFEPDPEEFNALSEDAINWPFAASKIVPAVLSNKAGSAKLHLTRNPNNISLLQVSPEFYARYGNENWDMTGEMQVTTTTLDDVLFSSDREMHLWGEILKVDTQGADYLILQGAEKTLSTRTVAVVCEAGFMEHYSGQALFSELEIYLRNLGFSFYGFIETNVRSKRLLDKKQHLSRERFFWVDAVFFKDPLAAGYKGKNLSMREIYSLFVSALLLKYYDFALELALKFWAKGDEEERIRRLVYSLAEYPAKKTAEEIEKLAADVKANPENANLLAGKFVDTRRNYCDYKDIK